MEPILCSKLTFDIPAYKTQTCPQIGTKLLDQLHLIYLELSPYFDFDIYDLEKHTIQLAETKVGYF